LFSCHPCAAAPGGVADGPADGVPRSLGPFLEEEKTDDTISVAFTLTATRRGNRGAGVRENVPDAGGEMAASHHLACG